MQGSVENNHYNHFHVKFIYFFGFEEKFEDSCVKTIKTTADAEGVAIHFFFLNNRSAFLNLRSITLCLLFFLLFAQ